MLYKDYITEVPDFPEEGVNFKDISPLLANQKLFEEECWAQIRKVHKTFKPQDWFQLRK